MPAYCFSEIGLTLDLIGAAFLSVEAIKLKNLVKLKDRLFVPLYRRMKPVRIVQDEQGNFHLRGKTGFGPDIFMWLDMLAWLFWHLLGGALLLFCVIELVNLIGGTDLFAWAQDQIARLPRWVATLVIVLGIPLGIPLIAVGPGELMHKILYRLSISTLRVFDWVDRRTPDGTTGIIGFGLLFAGFVGQMLGTWLGAIPLGK